LDILNIFHPSCIILFYSSTRKGLKTTDLEGNAKIDFKYYILDYSEFAGEPAERRRNSLLHITQTTSHLLLCSLVTGGHSEMMDTF
jgi:hypothetical protein